MRRRYSEYSKLDLPLSGSDLISIVIFGAFQEIPEARQGKASVQFKEDLDYELMVILNREKHNIPLISDFYYFNEGGAFPYSEQVAGYLFQLAEEGALTRIMGEKGRIARPTIEKFARDSLSRGKISREDYDQLLNLGKELGVRRTVYI